MGQLVIDPGGAPVSSENVENLRGDVQNQLGIEHHVLIGREARQERSRGAAGPYIDLLWSVGGGVIIAAVLGSIKAGVKR